MNRVIKFRVWDTKLQKMMGWNPFIRFDDSEYVVQQFTGLFDSAGREIYEGDIVEYECNDPRFSRSVVRWTHEHEDNHPGFMISSSWSQYGNPTIVGNIYENSELLVN